MTFPEQYAAVVKMARSTGSNEWALDDDDEAHLQHIHSNPGSDRLSLGVWADKLQENGHDDLAHMLRHGAEHGVIERGSTRPDWLPEDNGNGRVASIQWRGGNSSWDSERPRHAAISFYFGLRGSKKVTVRVPTARPEYRQMATEMIGTHPGSDPHWQGSEQKKEQY
jgi:hypothetical protein